MPIDINGAVDNFSYSSSLVGMQQMQQMQTERSHSSMPSTGSGSLGPMMVRYSSSRLTSIDGLTDVNRDGTSGGAGPSPGPGAFAVCVHWCSHRAVAFGLTNGGPTSSPLISYRCLLSYHFSHTHSHTPSHTPLHTSSDTLSSLLPLHLNNSSHSFSHTSSYTPSQSRCAIRRPR